MENTTELMNLTLLPKTIASYQDFSFDIALFFLIVKVIMCVIILVLNALVIVVYTKNKQLGSSSHVVFILALAVTDFFTALWSVPVEAYKNLSPVFMQPSDPIPGVFKDVWFCAFMIYSALASPTLSVVTCVVISIDRFIAVFFPMKHKSLMTRTRAIHVTVASWIFCQIPLLMATFSVLSVFTPVQRCHGKLHIQHTMFLILTLCKDFFPIPICFILYLLIILKIRNNKRQVYSDRSEGHAMSATELRITYTMFAVIFFLTVCSLPFFLVMNQIVVGDKIFVEFSITMMQMNSLCNPIVYVVVNKKFRESIRCLLRNKAIITTSSVL